MKKLLNKIFKIDLKEKISIYNKSFKELQQTGKTPKEGHLALIDLYCKTNGKFNDKINKEIIKNNPKKNISNCQNSIIAKDYSNEDYVAINKTLNKDGYVIFNDKLSENLVSKLYDYALKTPTLIAPNYDKPTIFESENLKSEMYRFNANDLMNNTDIQELVMDPFLINIARNYLESEPIFDFPAMWWSTPFLKEASSEAAQLYHFDLDRVKWLKIFFYLTDVDADTGPHCYIKASHISGSKPKKLLKRGYARITDEDLQKYYKKEDFKVVCASAGSIFAGDTKCWHKGTPLKKGNRLVLELEYTTSLFGANYDKFLIENYTQEFKDFCEQNPFYCSHIDFKNK